MNALRRDLEQFAMRAQGLSEADLNRAWNWKGYEEGIRFTFFRINEELRKTSALISPANRAQRILTQYCAATWYLRGVLLGIPAELFDTPPAEGEWSVRKTLTHIIEAEWGFFGVFRYYLDHPAETGRMPMEFFDPHYEVEGNFKNAPYGGSLNEILEFYDGLHQKILARLSEMSDADLERKAYYWEEEALDLGFRLHRFESHLRQHTIQIEKTLAALGYPLTEARMLLRMVYTSYGELEGALLSRPDQPLPDCSEYFRLISV